ncbi:hypothetical protein [Candidatus Albibeggiatoa sp. nov. BB20]|uniref:hypothetical protein n=1 Tax=Candidatus Albibeggiatoa sp. nov. BB20 TaxID=3162723 RepID=UPI0033657B0B
MKTSIAILAVGFVYGGQNYNWHSEHDRAILNQLYEFYKQKGAVMPYTMDDFVHDYVSENLHVLSPDEVLQRYFPEMLRTFLEQLENQKKSKE